jgi:SAM-dependent methyltransferase
MDLAAWNLRYRSGERANEDVEAPPTKLLIDTAARMKPRKALDLACGTGRNALWLAKHGWQVTAVDGADSAIEILRHRAAEHDVEIEARVADLEKGEYRVEPASWDLIAICYYLQRDLLQPAKRGLVPGGVLVCIVHIVEGKEQPTATRMRAGELAALFEG